LDELIINNKLPREYETETKGDSGSTAHINLSALRLKGLEAGLLTRSCLWSKTEQKC
jgi:hypothetical protein